MENKAPPGVPAMPDEEAYRSIAARVDLALALLTELKRALPDPCANNFAAALHVCNQHAAEQTGERAA